MKKLIRTLLSLTLVLTLPIGCTVRVDNPWISATDAVSAFAGTTAPESVQNTSSAPEQPPAPTLDADALVSELSAWSDADDLPAIWSADFFRWLADRFGTELLETLVDVLERDGYSDDLWYSLTGNTLFVLSDLYTGKAEQDDRIVCISTGNPDTANVPTVMTFGGDICFADNYLTMEYMAENGLSITDCIDERLVAEMQAADIAFMNNEFTISDRGTPLANKVYTFRAAPENTALYQTLGINIVSLANNHAYDYGADAFADTMQTLEEYGIASIGGGMNLEEAMRPMYYLVNGRKIAFVAATRAEKYRLTPQATDSTSGVLRCYDPTLFLEVIREARANSDFVVACIHWGTEYSAVLEDVQKETARTYIDAGADLIVGGHAHQLQGIEFYNSKAIFYNLGNFWFNNKEIETGLLKVELYPDGTTKNIFLPALQKDCQTAYLLGTERGDTVLEHLEDYSINAVIDESGLVTELNK